MAGAFFAKSFSPLNPRHLKLSLGLALGAAIGYASFSPQLAGPRSSLAAALSIAKHQPCVTVSPFACLTALAEGLPNTVTEPTTGASFPALLDDGNKQLAGVGLRKKSILGLKNITVYAFGIYADEASLKDKLGSKYLQQSGAEIKANKAFYDDIVESDLSLTVRLVIVYGRLKIGSVRSAFEESIGNRIKKFSGAENRPLLESFTQLFRDEIKLPRGTTIDISRCPGHILQTKIDGIDIGNVHSSLLCRSFVDLYIGEDPFDLQAKEEIGLRLASFVNN